MIFQNWGAVILLGLFVLPFSQCEKEWSWGKDDTDDSPAPVVKSQAEDDQGGPRARSIDSGSAKETQGRTFKKFFNKLACKFGKCEEEYAVFPGPVPILPGAHPINPHVVPHFPLGPTPVGHHGISPLPIGPPPVVVPSPIIGPGPVAILPPGGSPLNPHHGLPNKGYPPIKPTKTEVHHHVHTHIHDNPGVIGIGSSPFKNTGYPPKKTGFSPTIAKPGIGSHHIGPKPIASNIGHQQTFGGVSPIAGKPEVLTDHLSPIHGISSSLYPKPCTCVLPHQCPSIHVIRKHGNPGKDISYLIHPRNEAHSINSNNTKDEVVYRERRDATVSNRLPKSSVNRSQKGRALGGLGGHHPGLTGCGPQYVCCSQGSHGISRNTCGKSYKSSAIHGRVANTDYDRGSTQFGQYPWQGAILRDEPHSSVFVCGATLVSAQHVLTAAHCIVEESPYHLKVRLGDWDVNSEAEFYRHVEFPVQKVNIHPDFYSANLNNDIAIITLQGYLDFHSHPHISPICLPERYTDFTRQHCYVTGWGKDAFGHVGSFQQILKEVDVPVVDRYSCERALQIAKLGPDYVLPEGFICAGGEEGKDTCKGDGGGPLVCPNGINTYELAGIVSWGIECGIKGIPGVYVNIPYYVEWIRSYIGY